MHPGYSCKPLVLYLQTADAQVLLDAANQVGIVLQRFLCWHPVGWHASAEDSTYRKSKRRQLHSSQQSNYE